MTRNGVWSPRAVAALGLVLVAALIMSHHGATARTRTRANTRTIERAADVRIVGLGASGIGPGDVNGDGRDDVAASQCLGEDPRTTIYVFFGPFQRDDRLEAGADGFEIRVPNDSEPVCQTAGAGDVNADGLADILVRRNGADNNGRDASGTTYVVFGKSDSEPVDLASFDQGTQGDAGFRIDGALSGDIAGDSAAGLGDVNQDGRDDVGVAAPFGGSVYVVFGKTDPLPVDLLRFYLGTQGPQGFRIDTGVPNRNVGQTVGATGDVNGDGAADIGIGYIPTMRSKGYAYVVFGKNDSSSVDVHDLGPAGFEMTGPRPRSTFGYAITEAGDANGDGLSDLLVSAPYRSCCGKGSVYVIFGRREVSALSTDKLGEAGYRIVGGLDTLTGFAISALGDANCDGRGDALIGEPSSSHGGELSGSIYVVYGKASTRSVSLRDPGRHGYRIDGARRYQIGIYVAGLGDVDGDGAPDLMTQKLRGTETSYLVLGRPCRT